jgi:signal transduction histidine kinase
VGLAQVALVAAFAFGASWLSSRMSRHWETRDLTSALEPLVDAAHADEMTQRLHELSSARDLELTVYGEDRKVFATSVTPALALPHFAPGHRHGPPPDDVPPPPPPPDDLGERPPPGPPPAPLPMDEPREAHEGHEGHDGLHGRHGLHPVGAAPPNQFQPLEHDGHVYLLVVHFNPGPHFAWGELFTLLAGLVVVGTGAIGTVRWITLPIARLTRAAQALGEGDLRVRAGLQRGDELGELGAAFDEMAGRMQRLLTAERELLANVSHELRTPLSRIKVALDLAVEGDADAARLAISEISLDLAELERLVEEVLQATRFALEDGRAPMSGLGLRTEVTSARDIAEESAQRFVAHHPQRTLNVRVPTDAELARAPQLVVDPQLLRRVLGNLLENAHKYTPEPDAPIDLLVETSPEDTRFSVVDRGIGIPTEELPRVFDPFYRSERSRSRGTGGVGLGLTLAKRIVEAHGGTIEVGRGVASGTRVLVTIPANAETLSHTRATRSPSTPPSS